MKRIAVILRHRVLAVLCVTGITALALASKPHEFQNGKLLEVGSDERLVEGTTVVHAIYQVQVADVVYFARGERVSRHGGDPAHGLVIGDQVQVAIDGDSLILKRPDGKEIKAKIVRRQRAEPKQ